MGSVKRTDVKRSRKPFRQFFYRGIEVKKLLDLSNKQLHEMLHARARRSLARIQKNPSAEEARKKLVGRLKNAIKKAGSDSKPEIIKTHLRNCIIVPEMVSSLVGVYNGKGYILVQVKPDMIGHYLGEFALTYHPVKHGNPGVSSGASRFIPLK